MTTSNRMTSDKLPLPTSQLHILLALATGDNHGYAIMKEIEAFTGGAVAMGPGTLYGAIKQMLRVGLIEESFERPDPALDDERRRYYRLTDVGADALDAEVVRLERLARTARARQAGVVQRRGA